MKYKDFDNYEICPDEDKIINIKRGKELNKRTTEKGYKEIALYKEGKQFRFKVHRVYWECVNGDIPDGYEIDHINGIKDDNRIENLRLVTHKENMSNPITVKKRLEAFKKEEYKEKRSKIMKGKFAGKNNPMYGKPRPEGGGTPPKPINAYKEGVLVGTFASINEAGRKLNVNRGNIYCVLKKIRENTNGYTFGYA